MQPLVEEIETLCLQGSPRPPWGHHCWSKKPPSASTLPPTVSSGCTFPVSLVLTSVGSWLENVRSRFFVTGFPGGLYTLPRKCFWVVNEDPCKMNCVSSYPLLCLMPKRSTPPPRFPWRKPMTLLCFPSRGGGAVRQGWVGNCGWRQQRDGPLPCS